MGLALSKFGEEDILAVYSDRIDMAKKVRGAHKSVRGSLADYRDALRAITRAFSLLADWRVKHPPSTSSSAPSVQESPDPSPDLAIVPVNDNPESLELVTVLKTIHAQFQHAWESTECVEPILQEDRTMFTDMFVAWEEKLYSEIKKAKAIRVKRKKNKDDFLHAQFDVAMKAAQMTRDEILRLTNSNLHPELLELLTGMHDMWKRMHEYHKKQLEDVLQMKSLVESDISEKSLSLFKVVSEELKIALERWCRYLDSFGRSYSDYIKHINSYIKVCAKANMSENSPQLPVFLLCQEWQRALDNLKDDSEHGHSRALQAIQDFVVQQEVIIEIQNRLEQQKLDLMKYVDVDILNKEIEMKELEQKHPRLMNVSAGLKTPLTQIRAELEVLVARREEEKKQIMQLDQSLKRLIINTFQVGLRNMLNDVTSYSENFCNIHDGVWKLANTSLLTDSAESDSTEQ